MMSGIMELVDFGNQKFDEKKKLLKNVEKIIIRKKKKKKVFLFPLSILYCYLFCFCCEILCK